MKRVVITGIGVVSPLGNDKETFWSNLLQGTSGIRQLTKLPASEFQGNTLAAEVNWKEEDESLTDFGLATRYAIAAARESLQDAGLPPYCKGSNNHGVIIGTTNANLDVVNRTLDTYNITHIDQDWPIEAKNMFTHVRPIEISSTISRYFNFGGPSVLIPTACAAGNYAIGTAYSLIRSGRSSVILAGGADGFNRSCYVTFYRLGGMTREDCRPFDKNRTGMVVGEGAGMLVLEELEHALARGARIYGEVKGYGISCDAYHRVAPDPEGKGASKAMQTAIQRSNILTTEIDLISAHGTGTPANDSQEVQALSQIFGDDLGRIPISAIKSMLGHCMGAASALEAIAIIMTIERQMIPPTINTTEVDPEFPVVVDVNPGTARKLVVRNVLSNAFGFGGNICSIVLGTYHPN